MLHSSFLKNGEDRDLEDFVHPTSAENHGNYEQAKEPFSALSQVSLVGQTLFHAFSKPSSRTLQTHFVHKMQHYLKSTGLKDCSFNRSAVELSCRKAGSLHRQIRLNQVLEFALLLLRRDS